MYMCVCVKDGERYCVGVYVPDSARDLKESRCIITISPTLAKALKDSINRLINMIFYDNILAYLYRRLMIFAYIAFS